MEYRYISRDSKIVALFSAVGTIGAYCALFYWGVGALVYARIESERIAEIAGQSALAVYIGVLITTAIGRAMFGRE